LKLRVARNVLARLRLQLSVVPETSDSAAATATLPDTLAEPTKLTPTSPFIVFVMVAVVVCV